MLMRVKLVDFVLSKIHLYLDTLESKWTTEYINMWTIDIEEYEKAAAVGSERGVRMRLSDIYHLPMLKPGWYVVRVAIRAFIFVSWTRIRML